MSKQYNEYLGKHKEAVANGFHWFKRNMKHLFIGDINIIRNLNTQIYYLHDESKFDVDEYKAYDDYFYNLGPSHSYLAIDDFRVAWLKHIHKNPHHWQYWVLIDDDGSINALDMPLKYIIEMICDWWSFSWIKGDLYEIFDWYDKHKDNMILSDRTSVTVENILKQMKKKLDIIGGKKND